MEEFFTIVSVKTTTDEKYTYQERMLQLEKMLWSKKKVLTCIHDSKSYQ